MSGAMLSASQTRDEIAAGRQTAADVCRAAIERMQATQPTLNAFNLIDADRALARAEAIDRQRAAGAALGPLAGVPVVLKDNLCVRGMRTTASSKILDTFVPPYDATVVRKLEAAGAVIVGKANCDEFAMGSSTENSAYGPARNPWDLDRTPGGSSGGSAAAVAAGLASAALGTDGAGSIRIPAACCGLFGLKVQRGRISTAPDVHPHRDMAVIGPIARTVEDAARLADVLKDGGPSYAEAARGEPGHLRVAVSTGVALPGLHANAEQLSGVDAAAALLRELGHEVIPRELDWDIALGNRVLTRFVRGVGDMAVELGHRERLSRRARGMARIGMMIPARAAEAAEAQAAADAERINRIFDESDVVLTPMFTRRPLRVREYDGASGLRTLNGNVRLAPYAGAFNHTGQPAVSVPVATASDGFPIGVQLVGKPDSEPLLIALSAQLERHTNWPARRPAVAA